MREQPLAPLLQRAKGWVRWGIFVLLLVSLLFGKLLDAEQRQVRRQLLLALELLKEKPTPTRVANVDRVLASASIPSAIESRRLIARNDASEIVAALRRHMTTYERGNVGASVLQPVLHALATAHLPALAAFDAAVADQPDDVSARLARGIQLARLAWVARGGDYATRTPPIRLEEMTAWQLRSLADLVEAVRLSTRPTPAVVELLGIARTYNHEAVAEEIFEEAIRLDPTSAALYDEYLVHLDAKWGRKTISDNQALLARARGMGLRTHMTDQTERLIAYLLEGGYADVNAADAQSRAAAYTERADTHDAWLWRAKVERTKKNQAGALAALERALMHDPGAISALDDYAYLLFAAGKAAESKAAYRRAASLGSEYAHQELIRVELNQPDGQPVNWRRLRTLCEDSAETLNPAGEFCIGGLYWDGLAGYPRDPAKAAIFFKRAAEKYHLTAQHDFGWMLISGVGGLTPDRDAGVYWLRQASQRGSTE